MIASCPPGIASPLAPYLVGVAHARAHVPSHGPLLTALSVHLRLTLLSAMCNAALRFKQQWIQHKMAVASRHWSMVSEVMIAMTFQWMRYVYLKKDVFIITLLDVNVRLLPCLHRSVPCLFPADKRLACSAAPLGATASLFARKIRPI
jgi:hypothetical protein